ncbi:MAG TPA: hypothetical protein VMW20_07710, partial [Candidatus Nanoarchaeia archaeon]|nr:hypothetical protein [Candidatus Nanoarchaeia archaeon]
EVQEVSPETWVHLEKVYMPMLLAGKLSLEYVLSQIPNLNIQEELERQSQMKEDELEKTKDELNKVIMEKGMEDNQNPGDNKNVNKNNISKGGDNEQK